MGGPTRPEVRVGFLQGEQRPLEGCDGPDDLLEGGAAVHQATFDAFEPITDGGLEVDGRNENCGDVWLECGRRQAGVARVPGPARGAVGTVLFLVCGIVRHQMCLGPAGMLLSGCVVRGRVSGCSQPSCRRRGCLSAGTVLRRCSGRIRAGALPDFGFRVGSHCSSLTTC